MMKSSIRLYGTLLLVLFFSAAAVAQSTPWSLEKCVNYALQNSLRIKQAQATLRDGELSLKQGKMSRLPSVNASSGLGAQFGRTIDPFTNSFATTSITFNSFGLSAGIMLYNGGSINAGINRSKLELEARQYDMVNTSNTLSLEVARAYLTILLAQEQLENAERQLTLSQQQLEQTTKLINAGALPPNDRLDVDAQVARNEQVVVEVRNAVTGAYLNLRQLMELPAEETLVIERPQINVPEVVDEATFSFPSVYSTALGNQPQIKAADIRLRAASHDITIARSGMLPTITFGGNLNTAFSSVAQQVTGLNTIRQSQIVFINGQAVTIETDVPSAEFGKIPYFDQLSNNFGQSVGLNLSIPIYNNHRNSIARRARSIGRVDAGVAKSPTTTIAPNCRAAGHQRCQSCPRSLDGRPPRGGSSTSRLRQCSETLRSGRHQCPSIQHGSHHPRFGAGRPDPCQISVPLQPEKRGVLHG
jgi:outer membrane protein